MATVTKSVKTVPPCYKDYVNFLQGYKNGKKDEDFDEKKPVRNFPLSNSSTSTSSLSSQNSDTPDFAKPSCISYNNYLENSKTKKFNTVKPNFDEKPTIKKSEIFIEIQPEKSVSQVSKMFESKPTPSITSKINVFQKQISLENKPKLAEKPKINNIKMTPPPPIIQIKQENSNGSPPPPPPPINQIKQEKSNGVPPPPPPLINLTKQEKSIGSPPLITQNSNGSPPPPPPLPTSQVTKVTTAPKIQATLIGGPQTKYSVTNPKRAIPTEIDRNNPLVKKLVYGTLRGMYGAYHDKANDIMGTLPKSMVKKSHGVQGIIDKIASNGDLDKLNGRVNPKLDQE